MKKKILCFDIDGVICATKLKNYKKSTPIKKNINFINKLHKEGYYIKLFTARYMGRSNENRNLAKKRASKITINQLRIWKVKYDEVIFAKPSYDYFIDDKAIFFKRNWIDELKKKLK